MQVQAEINKLVDHLFRHEAGKLISVLIRIFGTENLELAEDVVQDALVEAIKLWSEKGVPDNPSAWLFRVAKNKALNIVNREKYKGQYASDAAHLLRSEWTAEPALNLFFSEPEILDDQLRTMFICCHPSISADSQVALILKTLCGFTISEIAKAFLTTEENINKRLVRTRHNIRDAKIPFEVPAGQELDRRLNAVLAAIYLLFNEGYSASRGNELIRYELCEEAIRLTELIAGYPAIQNKTNVYGLLALMQLNASRFKARQDGEGNLLTMEEQDRESWNRTLIENGLNNIERSVSYQQVSRYNLMAAISAYHCTSVDFASTDWKGILLLYDNLTQLDNSPVILLNRAVALSKVDGPEKALGELAQLKNIPAMQSYYLLYSTEAEFYKQLGRFEQAAQSLEAAMQLTTLQAEKDLLQKRLSVFKEKIF